MDKIRNIVKKILTKEIILYIIFGLLTTAVNLLAFYIMYEKLNWNKNLSNFIAIVLAVLFAYITNKDWVFHSEAVTLKEKRTEFFKFISSRAFTMAIEFFGGLILFETAIPEMISKCLLTIIVIILNFFLSKFFAFTKKKQK